jgi:hypothetical protein
MDTVEIVKIYGTKQSTSCTKQDRTCNPDTLGKPTTSISWNQLRCLKFRAHTCVHISLQVPSGTFDAPPAALRGRPSLHRRARYTLLHL